ncbi:Crp/Fnr family transcriptional regulator [candidate division WWE3 bacterium]|jgi:CRP/FNR family transcriptional regulator|uniref:Crp/Fnr family transcriptional regulator n=1 Tax=candidate division WWE3 bacterium TaxID=2053526 RepID=A0A3A4ZIA1_UNCKA|nr:MAG: Crp/Fnr family transcriptional regulator [candidate division WWE3 bacterium]
MPKNNINNKLEAFFIGFKHQTYKKGEILVRSDEEPQGVYYLKNGLVRQYSISKDGEELTLNMYKPETFFPLMSAFTSIPNTYYFEAATDVQVFKAPQDVVLNFLKNESDISNDLITRLYKGMHGLLTRIEYLMSGSAYSKIIYMLLNTAYRFGERNHAKEVEVTITHREISALTGLTKETISRECTRLSERGLIENTKNHVVIKSLQMLEEELLGA